MSLQVFPEPSINASQDGVSYTIPTGATQYRITETFVPGIYQITTSPTTSQAFIEFVIGGTISSTTTVSGSINYNLSSSCSETLVSGIDPSATNTIISFDKIGSSISGTEITGTLDTLTTTGTYNQTGKLYVVAVGGGAGGAGSGGNYGGGGGGSGGVAGKLVYTNTSTSYTIGSGGNGGAPSSGANCDSGAGGTTNFGNLLSATGGGSARSGNTGQAGTGGTPGGGAGGLGALNGQGDNGSASTKIGQTVKAGSTGGGGGGGAGNAITDGGGDGGIGTGGRSGIANQDPNAQPATGYGSGGGGGRGGSPNHNGGVGRPGVIYVLRGF